MGESARLIASLPIDRPDFELMLIIADALEDEGSPEAGAWRWLSLTKRAPRHYGTEPDYWRWVNDDGTGARCMLPAPLVETSPKCQNYVKWSIGSCQLFSMVEAYSTVAEGWAVLSEKERSYLMSQTQESSE